MAHARIGRPSKGARVVTVTRLPEPVHERVRQLAAERGTTISQVVADITSKALGRNDLALELHQEVLPTTA